MEKRGLGVGLVGFALSREVRRVSLLPVKSEKVDARIKSTLVWTKRLLLSLYDLNKTTAVTDIIKGYVSF